jgi:hypothetical protein
MLGFVCNLAYDIASYTCTDQYTKWSDVGTTNANLDLHKVECPARSGIGGFEFPSRASQAKLKAGVAPEKEPNGNSISIHYTCCTGTIPPPPTLAPRISPTPVPSITPTPAPSFTLMPNIGVSIFPVVSGWISGRQDPVPCKKYLITVHFFHPYQYKM